MSNENEKLPRDFDMPTHSPYDDIVEKEEKESYEEKATKAMHMGFPFIPIPRNEPDCMKVEKCSSIKFDLYAYGESKQECQCSGYTLLHFGCKCK